MIVNFSHKYITRLPKQNCIHCGLIHTNTWMHLPVLLKESDQLVKAHMSHKASRLVSARKNISEQRFVWMFCLKQ